MIVARIRRWDRGALELIADPHVNLLAMGPHPADSGVTVFPWYEMSDAVQAETYKIDGVDVSNFVLPLYFTADAESDGRNDFLGTETAGKTLLSFGVNPGGYVGFYDPRTGQHDTCSRDNKAERRREVKATLESARRAIRYQRFHSLDSAKTMSDRSRAASDSTAAILRRLDALDDKLTELGGDKKRKDR
jgi:hypothetical protein